MMDNGRQKRYNREENVAIFSDIKRGQAIWKRSRDEVKPTDD